MITKVPATSSFVLRVNGSIGLKRCSSVRTITKAASSATDTQQDCDVESDSYQFMQRSTLPTLHFQRSLPRLPIPQLEKTCERFLAAVEPSLTAEEYAQSQACVSEFSQAEGGVGVRLNELLKAKDAANKHTSYISQPWFDMYLSDRAPLPLNYNPLLVMNHDTRPAYQTQTIRASNLVISSLRFWRSLQAGLLAPEVYHLNPKKSDTEQFRRWTRLAPAPIATYVAYVFKAFPLDMSQYNRLFGVSRIPELGKDYLVQCTDSRHILVMRRGNMYAVDVLDANGSIEAPQVIFSRIKTVIDLDAKRPSAEVPLGVLTAGNRDDWARTRKHLVNGISEANKRSVEQEIDAALFCLSLDSPDDPCYNEENPTPVLKHLLAGEAKNRWFDKSVSLLVSADGTAAVNFEHSWGDGVAVLRYFNEIYKETLAQPFIGPETTVANVSTDDGSIRPINLNIDNKLRSDTNDAIAKNAEIIKQLDMHMLRYPHLSKTSCKRDGISPDSIMQLSFQLAYRQAFKAYVGSYESCSTAAFRHGRTETMRPCTKATKRLCEAVLQPTKTRPSFKELRHLIDQCSRVHGQLTKEAAMGQGFDRHLFALKHMAATNDIPIPDLYATEAYKKINYNIISTSTLSSDALLVGSFGPVVQDGLGIGYSMRTDECGAIVTSYKGKRDGKYFIENLEEALSTLQSIISESRK